MRTRTSWLIWLLAAGATLLPLTLVHGQTNLGYELPQPDVEVPVPLGHDRMEKGGFFMDGSFVMYRQNNPLQHQPIAVEGFWDADGTISGAPGTFIGSHRPVLFADDAGGPLTYQPGFRVGAGWRFEDGSTIEVSWMNLFKSQYQAVATFARPLFQEGQLLQDSFISSPVYNFPGEYAGPPIDTGSGDAGSTFGIWNAADVMSIEFIQRVEEVKATYRVPIFEEDCWRCYGLVGPRFFWVWERFKWRTVDLDANGQALPSDVAIYTNIVSNRMYGAFIGGGNEWYLGHGFSVSLDASASLFLDVVKERAKYELGDKFAGPQSKRGRTEWTAVPEAECSLNLFWYPMEAVQLQLGYDLMVFFNTVASKEPVSFNYGGLDPAWDRFTRTFDGFHAGIAFIF